MPDDEVVPASDGDGKAEEPKEKPERRARKKATPPAAEGAGAPGKPARKSRKKPAARKPAAKRTKAIDHDEPEEPEPKGPSEAAGKALVIVESPAKAKTINKYLGKGYVVRASMGHVRDLPRKQLAVDLENGFAPTYEVLAEKKKIVSELKRHARDASAIYLACDPDREGEAIAWHISEILGPKRAQTYRVTFNEITKSAIEKAFEVPRQVDMSKVNAQQARRILDRIVGYKLSPLLWKKIARRNLSAGRVQSVAVKLVVEREKEIKAFVPIEYWDLEATLEKTSAPATFFAKLRTLGGEKLDPTGFRVKSEAEAAAVRAELEPAAWKVASVDKAERRDYPQPPFITSTLQQAASTQLRFPTNKTMRVAQQLYEGVDLGAEGAVGLITYMRTDSFNLSREAVEDVRGLIRESFGDAYVPESPNAYKTKSASAQEAHEAIRPSYPRRRPEEVASFLTPDQHRLYSLIWSRFVACQMTPAVYQQTTVDVEAVPPPPGRTGVFRATGRTVLFPGHTRVSGAFRVQKKDEDTTPLPELAAGEALKLAKLQESQHHTQPPPRYTEASLVKVLEEQGIGRPSTYAAIISTIQDREYVRQESRRLHATELGRIVTEKLEKHFQEIMDVAFTRQMEDELDKIEDEKRDWVKVLEEFYGPFKRDLKRAEGEMKGINEEPEPSNQTCPKCGTRLLVYKYNKKDFSRFLGCPGYEDDGCNGTMPVDEKGDPQVPEETGETCPDCGSSVVIKSGKRGRFLACSAYPKCNYTRELDDEGKKELLPGLESTCDVCGKKMIVRRGRRGPFLGCTGYPECRSTRPVVVRADGTAVAGDTNPKQEDLPEVTEKCPRCSGPMRIRRSARGPFLGCAAYPKCKGTRQVPDSLKEKLPAPPPPQETGEKCEQCGKPLVLKQGRRGPFIACSGYPKCRNTRNATV